MKLWRNQRISPPTEFGPGDSYLRRPWKSATQRVLPILLGAAVVFSILSLVLGDRGVAQLWELAWRQKELRGELGSLELEAANLRWELEETGSMAVERPAREKFHMQRPGEIVYYFPRVETQNRPTSSPEKTSTESTGTGQGADSGEGDADSDSR